MVMLSITHHCLKTAVHLDEERGLVCHGEHPLLDHGALDVVVLDDDVLLQDLDGVQLVGALSLGQHHLWMEGWRELLSHPFSRKAWDGKLNYLSEGAFPEHHEEIEVGRLDHVLAGHVVRDQGVSLRRLAYLRFLAPLRIQLEISEHI